MGLIKPRERANSIGAVAAGNSSKYSQNYVNDGNNSNPNSNSNRQYVNLNNY